MISVAVTNVYVDDQSKALAFYTEILGFEKKRDIPLGAARWLTVASPAQPDGVELLLEPNGNPIASGYQAALFEAGIPAHTVFVADDIQAEHARMTELGVVFTMAPTRMGPATQAVFDDTCGNLILMIQVA
jgi:predicted enzyme related to lactoylglutathione lyase